MVAISKHKTAGRPALVATLTAHDLDTLRDALSIVIAQGYFEEKDNRGRSQASAVRLLETLERLPNRGPFVLGSEFALGEPA